MTINDAVMAVTDAWTVPGPVPGYHYQMQAELARRWPVLVSALVCLAEAVEHDNQ